MDKKHAIGAAALVTFVAAESCKNEPNDRDRAIQAAHERIVDFRSDVKYWALECGALVNNGKVVWRFHPESWRFTAPYGGRMTPGRTATCYCTTDTSGGSKSRECVFVVEKDENAGQFFSNGQALKSMRFTLDRPKEINGSFGFSENGRFKDVAGGRYFSRAMEEMPNSTGYEIDFSIAEGVKPDNVGERKCTVLLEPEAPGGIVRQDIDATTCETLIADVDNAVGSVTDKVRARFSPEATSPHDGGAR